MSFWLDYYDDRTRWALPMQLSFLALRSSQLRQVKNPIIETTVVDYSYLKDPAFAHLLLRDRELRLYEQIADAYRMVIPLSMTWWYTWMRATKFYLSG